MRTLTNTLAPLPTHPDDAPPADPGLIPLTVAEVNAWPTCSPGPAAHSPTTCGGRGGDVATKPAPAGSTTAPDYAAASK
jgi:hypothetical protein